MVAAVLCQGSPGKKRISDSDQFKGTDGMCFLKMSASSRTGDDGDVVCGGLAICWMLSSCWDCSLILGPELWNNPPPPSAPLSPSPSVCPEDRHPDSARSHYLLSYVYNNNNNNKIIIFNNNCNIFSTACSTVILAFKRKIVKSHTMYFSNQIFFFLLKYFIAAMCHVKTVQNYNSAQLQISRISVVI